MTPVLVFRQGKIGIVLVKEMVLTLPLDYSIWIIHPIGGRQKVVCGSVDVVSELVAHVKSLPRGKLDNKTNQKKPDMGTIPRPKRQWTVSTFSRKWNDPMVRTSLDRPCDDLRNGTIPYFRIT